MKSNPCDQKGEGASAVKPKPVLVAMSSPSSWTKGWRGQSSQNAFELPDSVA